MRKLGLGLKIRGMLFWAVLGVGLIAGGEAGAWSLFGGGGGPVGATEITQLLNNTELIAQYKKQIEQYQAQIEEIVRLKKLWTQTQGQQYGNAGADLAALQQILASGASIGSSASAISANYTSTFGAPPPGTSFQKQADQWDKTSSGTTQAALQLAGTQRDKFAGESIALQRLADKSMSANNDVQSQQAMSALLVESITHLQKLRDMLSAQSIAQNTEAARLQARQKDADKTTQFWMTPKSTLGSAQTGEKPLTEGLTFDSWKSGKAVNNYNSATVNNAVNNAVNNGNSNMGAITNQPSVPTSSVPTNLGIVTNPFK